MNSRAKTLSLTLAGASIGGVIYYFVFGVTASIYIAWVSMILAWTIIIFSMAVYLSKIQATQAALLISFLLAVGSFIASAFHDTLIAWIFLIVAVVSLPITVALVRRLSSTAQEDHSVPGTKEGLGTVVPLRWISLGTTIVAVTGVGYLGWRVWPRVSANVLILATILLIVLTTFSIFIKRADKSPERWLSMEGVFALSGLLNELLFPAFLALLLLNIAIK